MQNYNYYMTLSQIYFIDIRKYLWYLIIPIITVTSIFFILNPISIKICRKPFKISFWCLLLILSLIFAANGAYLLIKSKKISNSLDDYCRGEVNDHDTWNFYIRDFLYIYSPAKYFFCQPQCPCKCFIELNSFEIGKVQKVCDIQNQNNCGDTDSVSIGEQFYSFESSDNGVTQAQKCTRSLESYYHYSFISSGSISTLQMYLNEIGTIEDKYKCSGICEKLPIYFFSDSSVGKPTQRCLEPIKEHFYGGMIIFGSLSSKLKIEMNISSKKLIRA